jgi:hypothetical protein
MKTLKYFIFFIIILVSYTNSFGVVIKSINKNLTIKELNGQGTVANRQKNFCAISGNFKKGNLAGPGINTKNTPVIIYEINLAKSERTNDWEYVDIEDLKSMLPGTWEQMAFSQNQLVEFCQNFSDQLNRDEYTYFIIKDDESQEVDKDHPYHNLWIAAVEVFNNDGISIKLFNFGTTLHDGDYLVVANNAKIGRKSMATDEDMKKLSWAKNNYQEKKATEARQKRYQEYQKAVKKNATESYNNNNQRNHSVVPKYRARGW